MPAVMVPSGLHSTSYGRSARWGFMALQRWFPDITWAQIASRGPGTQLTATAEGAHRPKLGQILTSPDSIADPTRVPVPGHTLPSAGMTNSAS